MTKNEAITHLCETVRLAYESIGDYTHPSDCFCKASARAENFQHDGFTLNWVREAVIERLKREGYAKKEKT